MQKHFIYGLGMHLAICKNISDILLCVLICGRISCFWQPIKLIDNYGYFAYGIRLSCCFKSFTSLEDNALFLMDFEKIQNLYHCMLIK
jgi:hypothetical protein